MIGIGTSDINKLKAAYWTICGINLLPRSISSCSIIGNRPCVLRPARNLSKIKGENSITFVRPQIYQYIAFWQKLKR